MTLDRRMAGRVWSRWAGAGLAFAIPAMTPAAQAQAAQAAQAAQDGPVVEIGDVARFFEIYDRDGGRPSAETLQTEYLEGGSEGLHTLARMRNVTGVRMAEAIATRPEIYEEARRCAAVVPAVRRRLVSAMEALAELYPQARFPPVTITVGRGRPVGVGAPDTGVQIGLEALCAATFLNPHLEDRFVHVVAHEFVHVQQAPEPTEGETQTVLEASLIEGIAEFVTERISGQVAYSHLAGVVAGRELEIETAFAADIDKTDLSDWLYNSTAEAPGDLGYWVGYRIAAAYFRNAPDKPQAIRDLLTATDAHAVLAASGWTPSAEP